MKHTKRKKKLSNTIAILLSVTVHGLLLLGVYYLPIYHNSTGSTTAYKIELDLQAYHETLAQAIQVTSTDQVPATALSVSEEGNTEQIVPKNPSTPLLTEQADQKITPQDPDKKNSSTQIGQQKDQPVADKRGLYKTMEDKKTGASLELVGWMWDFVPHPQDDTSEIGKLVFEIIIDDAGEIIGIKTLEKTVSPLIEQLYKDEVAKLTFSKISKNITYAPTSTGKITFILQYR